MRQLPEAKRDEGSRKDNAEDPEPFDIEIGNQHQIFKIKKEVSVFTADFKKIEPGTHEIVITVPDAISPKDLGMSRDPRKLGASLVHLSLEPVSEN